MLSKLRKRLSRRSSTLPKETIQGYYNQLSDLYEDPVKAVGWLTESTQNLRFSILSLVGDLNNTSILDCGCGLGDLHAYLAQDGQTPDYNGIDISQNMIQRARSRHPGVAFDHGDFLDLPPEPTYDYVLASGALSYRVPRPRKTLHETIRQFYALAKQGVAFNLLSSHAPSYLKVDSRFYYYSPEEVLSFCLALTPYVELKHHYLANDFTVYMYANH